MTDQADRLYNALPERLYLLDEKGIVRFKTVAGSRGFKPEDWAGAIADLVGPDLVGPPGRLETGDPVGTKSAAGN